MADREPTDRSSDAEWVAEAQTIIDPPRARAQGEATDHVDEHLSPGMRLGRYVVLEEIGSGGMGLVLSAYDPELNRKVALKLLRPRHRERKKNRARLLKEAQALAKLAHPHVITVYDVGTYRDRVFVAMELVEGDTLKGWLQQRRRRWSEVLEVFVAAGRGLAAAHAAHLVHRDIKPDNILIGRDGRVRVMDFGLARPMQSDPSGQSGSGLDELPELDDFHVGEEDDPDEEPDEVDADPPRAGDDVADPLLTQTGSILGTPAYMAPEQHMGKPTDARSDQFSFCISLYQALYGERPFDGDDRGELTRQKLAGEIREPPAGVSVPGWVRRIVLRGLSPDPDARFASMDALLDALGTDPRDKWRKIGTGAGIVGAMAAMVLGIQYYHSLQPKFCEDSADTFAAVWNAERKTAAQTGLGRIDRAHVAATWDATVAAIDAYGERWVELHTEACEATHVRGEQSTRLLALRNNCLQERLDEIDALADLLTEPTEGMAARATETAYGLSPLSACADAEVLADAVDPPQSEQTQRAVAQLRRELARVKIVGMLGLHDRALELANSAYETAEGLDYPPVLAEARYRLGQVQGLRGDGEQAKTNLSEAAWLGASVKHDSIAAAAASELVHVVGRRMKEAEEGLSWARHAEAALKRIGLGGFPEARLRHDIGVIHAGAGAWEEAEVALEQAIALYDHVVAAHFALNDARRSLGEVRIHQARLDIAQAEFERAQTATVSLLGPQHPEVAQSMVGLAQVDDARGDHDAALRRFEAAVTLVETAVGDGDLALVPVFQQIANSHARSGDHEQAARAHERIHSLLRDQLGEHPSVAAALFDIGNSLEAAGDPVEARAYHERALVVWEHTRGKDHPDLAYALTTLGLLDVEAEQAPQAVERLERALKLRGGRGLDPRLLAHTQFALARALHATGGDPPRARELATKARDTFASGKSTDPARAAEIESWLETAALGPASR